MSMPMRAYHRVPKVALFSPALAISAKRFLATFAFMMQSNGSKIWVGSPAFLHGRIVSTRYSAVAIID